MLPHVQLRSGGLAVPITIIEVVAATAQPIGNDAARLGVCSHGRAPHDRTNFSRL